MPRFIEHEARIQPRQFGKKPRMDKARRDQNGNRSWNGRRSIQNHYSYCKKGVRSYVSADKSNGGVLDYYRRHQIGVRIFVQIHTPERIAHGLKEEMATQTNEEMGHAHSPAVSWIRTRPDGTIGIHGIDTDLIENHSATSHHNQVQIADTETHATRIWVSGPLAENIHRGIETISDHEHESGSIDGQGHGSIKSDGHVDHSGIITCQTGSGQTTMETDEGQSTPEIGLNVQAATSTTVITKTQVQQIASTIPTQTQDIEIDDAVVAPATQAILPQPQQTGANRHTQNTTGTQGSEIEVDANGPIVESIHTHGGHVHASMIKSAAQHPEKGNASGEHMQQHISPEGTSHQITHRYKGVGYYGSNRTRQMQLRTAAAAAGISE